MENILNDYLEKVERHLKPLPISERVDIIKEIQSEISELRHSGKSAQEIIERLGNPKDLAKAYLGDLITKGAGFGWSRFLAVCAYYSLAGLSGVVIIPTLLICSPVFLLCGIVTPVMGGLKWLDNLLHLGLPFARNIGISGVNSPFLVFILCIPMGAALFLAGIGCWKLLIRYIRGMNSVKKALC